MYWKSMSPGGGGEPPDELMNAVRRDFGDLNAFRAHFTAAAGAIEGSGWAILGVLTSSGRLGVFQCENHQNLVPWGVVPILVCDVWEHAYFMKYRHRRAEYLRAFFNVVDWQGVAANLTAARR
jgi:Fe-Mn family superoxide dismutase